MQVEQPLFKQERDDFARDWFGLG